MAASNCPSSSLSPPSPNKRRKNLSSSNPSIKEDSCDQESLVNEERCGICLRSYGDSIRGRMDCCDHFFCFVCIMQWAKTESCCPTCRRRFSSIHRPPKPDVFPNPCIVNVPIRDQEHLAPSGYLKITTVRDIQREMGTTVISCILTDNSLLRSFWVVVHSSSIYLLQINCHCYVDELQTPLLFVRTQASVSCFLVLID